MLDVIDIDRLRHLFEAASNGPWRVRRHPHDPMQCHVEAPRPSSMAYDLEVLGDDYTGFGGDEQRQKDVEFVAAVHEVMPEILEELFVLNGLRK